MSAQDITPENVDGFVFRMFGTEMHQKRVASLATAVAGTLKAASLSVALIGAAFAETTGRNRKHTVKQIDRLMSNNKLVVDDLLDRWVAYVVGQRQKVIIALDWTDFEKDDQVMLAAYVITKHGRATPLMWKTVRKSTIKGKQTQHEDAFIDRLNAALPKKLDVLLLADRGFADKLRFEHLDELGFGYIIRFRSATHVTNAKDEMKAAKSWVPKNGRSKRIDEARITKTKAPVPVVVCVKKKNMAEAWCLATNRSDLKTPEIVKTYGRRFTIEESFRDVKDIRFGMGLRQSRVKDPEKRDRIMLLGAVAYALLTLLGEAGEQLGMDRMLKVNTVKRRTMSLYRQGLSWFRSLPNMPDERAGPLMQAFDTLVQSQPVFQQLYGPL